MDDQMIQAFTIFVKYQKCAVEWFDAKKVAGMFF